MVWYRNISQLNNDTRNNKEKHLLWNELFGTVCSINKLDDMITCIMKIH